MKKKRKIQVPRKTKRKQKSFTLLEIMVVLAIIVIVAVAFFVLINPKKQIERSWDGKRKAELSSIAKALEDFYNDKSCYPKPNEICYKDKDQLICPICGTEADSPSFSPYLSQLPCDPGHLDYLYEIDDIGCPTLFRIYTKLSDSNDSIVAESGCGEGCGPALAYSYGVASPNTTLETTDSSVAVVTDAPTPTDSNSFADLTNTPIPTSSNPVVAIASTLTPTPTTTSWTKAVPPNTNREKSCNTLCPILSSNSQCKAVCGTENKFARREGYTGINYTAQYYNCTDLIRSDVTVADCCCQ